ncbi:transposase family protein [Streptomyces rapamycinicus]|uniref:transposase family protein n=1 Tax=Streptomyces rapamycinicus TaxID=1226757 RepID=UPI0021FA1F40|nr:transposase family protein [Streptomyces rapamycinicus]UTP30132.1 transposase family protein [Streptomyces rapamycinicus NRRL 5491]
MSCPTCGTPPGRVYGFHGRVVADVPVDGRRVVVSVQVRRLSVITTQRYHRLRYRAARLTDSHSAHNRSGIPPESRRDCATYPHSQHRAERPAPRCPRHHHQLRTRNKGRDRKVEALVSVSPGSCPRGYLDQYPTAHTPHDGAGAGVATGLTREAVPGPRPGARRTAASTAGPAARDHGRQREGSPRSRAQVTW